MEKYQKPSSVYFTLLLLTIHFQTTAEIESPQILFLKHEIVTTLHFHNSAFIICLEILMHTIPSLMLAEEKKLIAITCHFEMLQFKTKDQKHCAFPGLPTMLLSFVEMKT